MAFSEDPIKACRLLLFWFFCFMWAAGPTVAAVEQGLAGVFASSADQAWQLQSYAAEAGLAHQRVFDVDFGEDDSVWLAASSGLYHFDGFRWTRYGREDGLPSDYVRSVCVTKAGALWVGTAAGAGVFDPAQARFDGRGTEAWLPNASIRWVREEKSGDLWFCCDQWPDTSVKAGGLSVLRADGTHQTYTQADGLPMNYVNGHHREASGVEWAFTPQGWVRQDGERWVQEDDPAAREESFVVEMEEAPKGVLLAVGESHTLMRRNGHWRVLPERVSLLCHTSKGEVLALERDPEDGWVWFSSWEGTGFVPRSARIPTHSQFRYYRMKEARDGAVWAVGYGTVVRWQRQSRQVEYYPHLPRPQFTDQQGRTWFAGNRKVVWADKQGCHELPALSQLIGVDRDGSVIGQDPATGLPARARCEDPQRTELLDTGFPRCLKACSDRDGALWMVGQAAEGPWVLVSRRAGGLLKVVFPEATITRVYNMHAAAEGGVSLCLFVAGDMRYRLARVSAEGVFSWVAESSNNPPLPYPDYNRTLTEDWVSAHTSLYVRPKDTREPWVRLFEGKAWGFQQVLTGGPETAVLFQGGPGIPSGCLLNRDGRWVVQYGDFYQAFYSANLERLYFIGPGGLSVRRTGRDSGFSFLPLPGEALAQSFAEAADGSLWAGLPEGVLHLLPRTQAPVALVSSPVQDVEEGGSLPVSLSGIQYMDTKAESRAFRYAWSIDRGTCTAFESGGERRIPLQGLAPGPRELRVFIEDAYGNRSAEPALLRFNIRPVPIQERSWFYGSVVGVAGIIVLLMAWGVVRTRQIARANAALTRENAQRRRAETELEAARGDLERKVDERTAELVCANSALRNEITERRQAEASKLQLEEQLRQSQKLQAIGTLAGGIAHDFNNILAIILPNLHLALEERTASAELREYLLPARQAAERARNLVKQILTFSRHEKQELRVIDLAPCLEEACGMVRSTLPAGTALLLEMEPEIPPVLADATQIHQVLLNLCTNAQHALGAGGGRISVSLGRRMLSEAEAQSLHGLKAGLHVLLSVGDNGSGMSEELQKRVFEPFFTTKEPGRGTGLGLSVVHGIVREHGGAIRLQSREGEGTCFFIYLPASAERPAPPESESAQLIALGEGRSVLVADDEQLVLQVVGLMLGRNGYRVGLYEDPVKALEVLKAGPAAWDLVLTDLSMPGMSGVELAQKVHALDPGLPVVLMSGYGSRHEPDSAGFSCVRCVLQKPVERQELLQTVQANLRQATVI